MSMAVVFGAAAGPLSSLLSVHQWTVQVQLASLLALPLPQVDAVLAPACTFAAAAIVALATDRLCRGPRRFRWLLFVIGGVGAHLIGCLQADYALPNAYAPIELVDTLRVTLPFALGAAAALGWRHWRSRSMALH